MGIQYSATYETLLPFQSKVMETFCAQRYILHHFETYNCIELLSGIDTVYF